MRENEKMHLVREELKKEYEHKVDTKLQPGTVDVHIILSQACLYYKKDSLPQQQPDEPNQLDKKSLITTEGLEALSKRILDRRQSD